ncbi:MAG TPA: hypothetical protein VHD36_17890 [Pirellulales bacterium]|nr:hypothetical protein [Pirellulales bacterium]
MRSNCLRTFVVVLAFLGTGSVGASAADLETLATCAVSADTPTSEAAISKLRAHGPAGLEALFTVHAAAIEKVLKEPDEMTERASPASLRIRRALDQVSAQRDCHASRLFWYTDLAQAEGAAKKAGKPILSLRLLGKLTDEYSCANSRFFRSTLYANRKVSELLRDRFVLHWQTERPVPVVTIDFGDGRKLIRTVAGNSVHYVLTPDGQPLDALPGLYGPQAFIKALEQADELAHTAMASGSHGGRVVAEYHARQSRALLRSWQSDLSSLGVASKGEAGVPLPTEATSDLVWQRIAKLHEDECQLDLASRNLIANRNPVAAVAGRVAVTKTQTESPLVRLVRELQGTIAIDTVRNEYLLHRQVHDWFVSGRVGALEALNERVYAELFLTPSSDPWLGLLPAAYSGLENDGVVMAERNESHPRD